MMRPEMAKETKEIAYTIRHIRIMLDAWERDGVTYNGYDELEFQVWHMRQLLNTMVAKFRERFSENLPKN